MDTNDYNVITGLALVTTTFHMEGNSDGYVNNSVSISSHLVEIEKRSVLDGLGRGYGASAGSGAGCSTSCGSGGGHGGSGASCSGCNSCAGGSTYDRYQ
ncbi:hypothetical protein DPMN_003925 [Dreissena polymorpha]|uniref:Uncharacterized protein n=2 Tax=Dreissena polymorpha TaxID=45954 RepID=A0A9D4MP90_DREPO|nr:hypothetical protein DPMN_003906 [Dreissena polymorpha]KAH3880013.1 hypothetical protein DPMN_003925 [Dreissena polymorpha]